MNVFFPLLLRSCRYVHCRYMQSCENFRRDVVVLGLPVLSYAWYRVTPRCQHSRHTPLPTLSSLSFLQVHSPNCSSITRASRYPKHIKEFEKRDADRRTALNLPNVSYPIYPSPVYQPYSFHLPNSYRISELYAANWRRYPGGIYSSGGMADQDTSHKDKCVARRCGVGLTFVWLTNLQVYLCFQWRR